MSLTPETIDAARKGDRAAQRIIHDDLKPTASVIASAGYGFNKADAEDIVHDCFLTLFKLLSSSKEIDNLEAYFYKMVRNRCLFVVTRSKRTVTLHDGAAIRDENEENEDLEWKLGLIRREIAKLDPLEAECFLMKNQGMTNQQIATRLGISKKTVANRLSQAKAQLRKQLQEIFRTDID